MTREELEAVRALGGTWHGEAATDLRRLKDALLDHIDQLTAERDEARESDAESVAMYRRARDRAEEAEAELREAREELNNMREMFQETRRRMCRSLGVEEGKSWAWLESELRSHD